MRALLIYPTHANCAEVSSQARSMGLAAAVYPGRCTTCHSTSDKSEVNCWNHDADAADELGFPVVKTICPLCPQRPRCQTEGYLSQLMAAKKAEIVLCTHKRAEFSGLAALSVGRTYVSIHENPIPLLRPQCACAPADLVMARSLLQRLLTDPNCLDWFGEDTRLDDEELALRRDRLYRYCREMAQVLEDMLQHVDTASRLEKLPPYPAQARPPQLERLLFHKATTWGFRFSQRSWRFILSAAAGELESAAVLVRRKHGDLVKSVIGFRTNRPSPASVIWFNDATLSLETLRCVLQMPVSDFTPHGHIELRRKAVQIPRDITINSSPKIFLNVLRAVLADRPQFHRVGLITHRPLLQAVNRLEPEFAVRLGLTTYFRSGEDRSSNAWHRDCDLIVVAGTPRVPPQAVCEYLIQIGSVEAAAREAVWGELRWEGHTESGERIIVLGRGYHDEDWRRAHRDLVRSVLVQAVGRGRGILDAGCEVVVISNEECGLPLSDERLVQLNQTSTRVLQALRELTMENSINASIGKTIVSTEQIAGAMKLSAVRVREILRGLEARGLVRKVGDRGGWLPVTTISSAGDAAGSQDFMVPSEAMFSGHRTGNPRE